MVYLVGQVKDTYLVVVILLFCGANESTTIDMRNAEKDNLEMRR